MDEVITRESVDRNVLDTLESASPDFWECVFRCAWTVSEDRVEVSGKFQDGTMWECGLKFAPRNNYFMTVCAVLAAMKRRYDAIESECPIT